MFSKQYQSPDNYESILGNSLNLLKPNKLIEAEVPTPQQQFAMIDRVPLRERAIIDLRGNVPQTLTESKVINEFFSEKNVATLLAATQKNVFEMSNGEISIPVQNAKNMLSAMNFIYETQRGVQQESELSASEQVEKINKRVLEFVVPHVYSEARSYSLFLQSQNEPLNPMSRAVQVDRDYKHLGSSFDFV